MTSDLNGIREASCATDSISVSLGCVALCNVTTWCNGAVGSVGFYIVRFCATHHPSRCAFVAWGQKKNRYPLSLRFILSLSLSLSFPLPGYIHICTDHHPLACVSPGSTRPVCARYTVCTEFSGCSWRAAKRCTSE